MPQPSQIVKLEDGRYQLPRFAIIDEHDFVDERGRKQKFDKKRLQRLANKLNRRVNDTGDEIPVVDGHTIDGMPNRHQPEVVGSTRDFRVEPFYKTGRYAIFATPIAPDESAVKEFKRKFRRSIELHVDPRGVDDDIDPIALLGSVSPKRDLGQPHRNLSIKFARASESDIKYLTPANGRIRYQKVTEEPDMGGEHEGGEGSGCTLSPEDIKAVVAEILQTEPMKKLMAFAEKLEGEEQGAEEGGEPMGGAPPGPEGGEPFAPEAEGDVEPTPPEDREGEPERKSAVGMGAAVGARGSKPVGYSRSTPRYEDFAGDPMGWLAEYEREKAMHEELEPVTSEVGRLKAEVARYKRSDAEKERRLAALERRNVELEINDNLRDLGNDFDFDPEEEFKRLVKMSRDARADHYELIRTRYARRQDQVPGGGDYTMPATAEAPPPRGRTDGAVSKYARTPAEAHRFASEMVRRGIDDPDELLAQLEKEAAASPGGKVRTR